MDDETLTRGMSEVEGYTLGRLAAQSERQLGAAAVALTRRLCRPAEPSIDVDALIADNERLRQELAAIQANFTILQDNHTRLKAWATQASQALDQHGLLEK